MKNKLTANQTLKLLKKKLPLCFKKGAQKLPLFCAIFCLKSMKKISKVLILLKEGAVYD